ncbi:MAG: hypothetical protein JO345_17710 [Streptosporangiaceae bacterium]|nr:hypothetical protein [Streptosporangiaceae bacterium]
MNSGNSVQDADSRCAPAANELAETVPGQDADQAATADRLSRPQPRFQHVQDIQELVDKLAAVTKQLRHPGHGDS